MIYSVFGDESYDSKRERVFAVAGVFGTEAEWDALAEKWTQQTGGEEFHAAQWERGNRHAEYAALTKILAASNLVGWGAVISLVSFSATFDNAADNFLPYYICFIRVVDHFGEFTKLIIPRGTVKFTFDQNLDVQYNAAAIYDHAAHLVEWECSQFLEGDLTFSSRKNPRIQAADLWTYEVMKHMDNTIVGPKRRPMRKSLKALRDTNRFGFDMFDSAYFEGQKKHALEHPRAADLDYHGWRTKHKLIDNTTTRVRYEIYLTTIERHSKAAKMKS